MMMICDQMALLILVQNDDDDDARHYGSLVTPRRYVINDFLQFVHDAAPWYQI